MIFERQQLKGTIPTKKGEMKMNCPVCDEKMKEIEKIGVVMDICPGCKGAWLDRRSLEDVTRRLSADRPDAARSDASPIAGITGSIDRDRRRQRDYDDEDDDRRPFGHEDDDDEFTHRGRPKRPGRKESWLSNLLDGIGGD